MAFMIPEYSNDLFADVTDEDTGESWSIPADYYEPSPTDVVEWIEGKWWVRLSAPGYLDCTEWSGPFDNIHAARAYVEETWDIDPDTGEEWEFPPGTCHPMLVQAFLSHNVRAMEWGELLSQQRWPSNSHRYTGMAIAIDATVEALR